MPHVAYKKLTPDRQQKVEANASYEGFLLGVLTDVSDLADPRWLAVARTHFEQGFMALNRAITETQQ
jgi:hypothetical protein